MSDREALDQLDRQIADEQSPPIKELMVSMTCSVKKQTFVARFTETSTLGWFFANSFSISGKAGSAAASLNSVPIGEMHWVGATCCICGARCAPILCSGCNNYVCDGGVTLLANSQRLHKCGCGSVGLIEPTLKTVSAAKGAGAREPGKTASSSPAAPLLLRFRGE